MILFAGQQLKSNKNIKPAADLIKKSSYTCVFTGAGISVESNIPPFRGENGIWKKYDPQLFDINYFLNHPEKSWHAIKKVFLDTFHHAVPNQAHYLLAKMEQNGQVQSIITQNIDYLHQRSGSKVVYEFHGSSQTATCLGCNANFPIDQINLSILPPRCQNCDFVLKPDFVFFGESIPESILSLSFNEATKADVLIIIGTTAEVFPAGQIPYIAKQHGAKIIEINPTPSTITSYLTNIFLEGKAVEMMSALYEQLA
jgi:NAD-dependent deacetylase